MQASMDEALSVFRKWKEDDSRVTCLLKLDSVGSVLNGTVFRVDSDSITIIPDGHGTPADRSGFITVSLLLARSISFVDPRSALTDNDREALSREISSGIGITFSSGERCILLELVSSM